ncbi:MAG: extracellular solute-binding protein [Elusimicrobiota bacterium]
MNNAPTLVLAAILLTPGIAAGAAELPAGVKWETNDSDPVFASPQAEKGGTFNTYMLSFPLTLRTVGPDSNGSFRSYLLNNQVQLTYVHPNTGNIVPGLATHWAHGDDHKTIYFKLDKRARWSDGKPVTAPDFAFALEFMRSKHIVAPWYNTYYTEKFDKVIVYDDHTFAVVGNEKKTAKDMHYYYAFNPRPRHFHKLDEKWVRDYNWKIEPNTGPYQISEIRKGKHIVFTRKKDWWAKDLKYFKNRFNPDRVRITVIRDMNIAWEHFKKGKIDGFALVLPEFWHKKATGKLFDDGYIHKLWFYHDRPQPVYGMWLNMDVDLFKDENVRLAFQHSMNIDKVIETVLRGDYERLHTNTTGHGKYTNKKIRARAFDLDLADKYLKKAGWVERGPDGIRIKDGKRLSARVTYGSKHHADRLVVLKEEAKKAGIELTLQLLDSAASFKTMLEKRHEIAWSGWGAMDRPQYWGQYHSKNAHKPQTNNFSNTDDPEMDRLIDAYRAAYMEDEKAQIAHKIQQRIYDGAYFIPRVMVPYIRVAYWRYVKFPEVPATKHSEDPFSYPFDGDWGGLFWIDKGEKERTKKARSAGEKFPTVTIIDKRYRPD